ncbi:ABC transporter substrate-binding protein [Dyella silvatica]|uniref:ABC transporter substrate-binding protein n=1 Tax=Dyella silvatica TaxID=2992128 RepID=UPI00224FB311|nr:hypothetical protein [Dyella silvatica]
MESGELLIGYNLLGSYVHARIARGAPLAMVLLEDYTLVITRTVLIPKTAAHPGEAAHFVDYLLSIRGQSVLAREGGILPIRKDLPRPALDFALDSSASGPMRPIRLGPGLLVYLDRWKRRNFIEDWKSALGESSASPLPQQDEGGQGELRAR